MERCLEKQEKKKTIVSDSIDIFKENRMTTEEKLETIKKNDPVIAKALNRINFDDPRNNDFLSIAYDLSQVISLRNKQSLEVLKQYENRSNELERRERKLDSQENEKFTKGYDRGSFDTKIEYVSKIKVLEDEWNKKEARLLKMNKLKNIGLYTLGSLLLLAIGFVYLIL